ncbi:MAG: hypothetical protein HY764_04585 [Candidatus Portnoybacteria bacterium]|nr:hypothetical protein [Candidatus Portnoybacteria bacterium]
MSNGTASVPGWYIEFQANVLRQLPRPEELKQKMAERWGRNQLVLKKTLTKSLLRGMMDDRLFFLVAAFIFRVPNRYEHETQLASFYEENQGKFVFYDGRITDTNYARVTQKFVRGKNYEVKIYGIRPAVVVLSSDCLDFMESQGAILVGAQGISLIWEQMRKKIPTGKRIISFDKKEASYNNMLPTVYHYSPPRSDEWNFDLAHFQCRWNSDNCFFCVSEMNN